MRTTLMCLAVLTLAACAGNRETQQEEIGKFTSDLKNIPTTRTLYNPVPVVLLQVQATDIGYSIRPFRTVGAPSSAINQQGDVVFKAMDKQGRLIAMIAIDNPRAVRTTGSKKPATATLPRATFTVSFAKPDNIYIVEVNVVNGPNTGLKETIRIDPRELKSFQDENK